MSYRIKIRFFTPTHVVILTALGLMMLSAVAAQPAAGADSLPDALKGFTISDSFVPLDTSPVGKIRALRGKLVVRHGRPFKAYYAKRGDHLYKNDILFTLEGARARLELVTADVITMGADTRISMDDIEMICRAIVESFDDGLEVKRLRPMVPRARMMLEKIEREKSKHA